MFYICSVRLTPTPLPEILPSFRWSPATQRRFVEVMAETGSVRIAAASVSKTHRAAYQLRKRAEGRCFGVGWDAATLIIRHVMEGKMMAAALEGTESVGVRQPGAQRLSWRQVNPALGRGRGMGLLTRLDRAVEKMATDAERYHLARLACGDFEVFLGLLGRDATDVEWRGFFAARQADENVVYGGYLHVFPPFLSGDTAAQQGRR
jgi:hypothetical protein